MQTSSLSTTLWRNILITAENTVQTMKERIAPALETIEMLVNNNQPPLGSSSLRTRCSVQMTQPQEKIQTQTSLQDLPKELLLNIIGQVGTPSIIINRNFATLYEYSQEQTWYSLQSTCIKGYLSDYRICEKDLLALNSFNKKVLFLLKNVEKKVISLDPKATDCESLKEKWQREGTFLDKFKSIQEVGEDRNFLIFFNAISKKNKQAAKFQKSLSQEITQKEKVSHLKKWVSQNPKDCANIINLSLPHSQCIALPNTIDCLVNLELLVLEGNHLYSLPESILQLVNLKYLDVKNNYLKSLPEKIGQLVNLQRLDLESNELTSLPESIGKCRNLHRINLRNNQLTSLPENIGELANLQECELSNNQLTSLPESITNLASLRKLKLWNNPLQSLPKGIVSLANLKIFGFTEKKQANLKQKIEQTLAGIFL